jgi:cell division protease FtsH
MAAHSQFGDPVHKITIIPHGRAALGYTLQLPEEDHYLMRRAGLLEKLKGLLGGRAAEEVVFQDISTGAENDLEQATALARKMVGVYGMSSKIGLVHCAQRQSPFSIDSQGAVLQRDCSEETAREIDEEVKKLLDQAYAEAKATLVAHRNQLNLIAEELLQHETLDGNAFNRLLRQANVSSPKSEDRVPSHS